MASISCMHFEPSLTKPACNLLRSGLAVEQHLPSSGIWDFPGSLPASNRRGGIPFSMSTDRLRFLRSTTSNVELLTTSSGWLPVEPALAVYCPSQRAPEKRAWRPKQLSNQCMKVVRDWFYGLRKPTNCASRRSEEQRV